MTAKFPTGPDDLTADWLAAELGHRVDRFVTTTLGGAMGQLGELVRVDIDQRDPLVAKFAADRPEGLALARRSGLFEREVRFYRELAPLLSVRIPRCHSAHYDPETAQFVLLLEHIAADEPLDQIAGLGLEQTRRVLDSLGSLHQSGRDHWQAEFLQPITYAPRLANLRGMIERGWPELVKVCDDFLDPKLSEDLADRIHATMVGFADLPQTVVHGDAKPDNMISVGGEMVLLDWQAVGSGPACWDVAYAMINCLSVEDRRAHEAGLLADYPADLTGYPEALVFGLVVAAAVTLLGDPADPRRTELIRSTAQRSCAAMADHGML